MVKSFMFGDVLVGLYRNLDLILLLVKHNFCKHVKTNNNIKIFGM